MWVTQLWIRIKQHPVEFLILLHALCTTIVNADAWWQLPVCYAPFATTSAFCISLFKGRWWWRGWYYWAVLPLYLLCVFPPSAGHPSKGIWILYSLMPAVYILVRYQVDKTSFSTRFLGLIRSTVVSLGIAMIVFCILTPVCFGIGQIFSCSLIRVKKIMAAFSFILLAPMVFFGMESKLNELKATPLEEILVNWILTPVLLIYTILLYIYLTIIVILWELPHQSLATVIFLYTGVAMLVRWLRPTFQHQPFGWFLCVFGAIVLPLVVLFWVGVCYRIGQYGLTENRCLLIAAGIMMTSFNILSMVRIYHEGYIIMGLTIISGVIMTIGCTLLY